MAPTDKELLLAWRDGAREAGQELIQRHYRTVYCFFFGKVDESASADLTQATFETLCRNRDDFRGESSLRTYIFGIARWKLVAHFRRGPRPGEAFDPSLHAGTGVDLQRSMSSLFADKRRAEFLVQALRTLPLDDQIILELRDYEELNSSQLAEMFEVPAPTMRRRVARARKRLREAVEALEQSPDLRRSILGDLDACMRDIRTAYQAHTRDSG